MIKLLMNREGEVIMNEKNKKESVKTPLWLKLLSIVLVVILLSFIIVEIVHFINVNNDEPNNEIQNANKLDEEEDEENDKESNNNFYIETYKNKDYYISNGEYKGEYDFQVFELNREDEADKEKIDSLKEFRGNRVMSYTEYQDFCDEWDLEQKYNYNDQKYLVYADSAPSIVVTFSGIEYNDKIATIYIWDRSGGTTGDIEACVFIIPTTEDVTDIKVQDLYSKQEFIDLTGANPLEGINYSDSDNKKIAEACYFETENEELNNIMNNMFDAMVQQHTIKIETENAAWYDCPTTTYLDLVSSSQMFICDGEILKYEAYTEEWGNTYSLNSDGTWTRWLGTRRDSALYELLARSEHGMIENPSVFNISIDEDADYYIITGEYLSNLNNQGTETYYINKTTNLLEKTVIQTKYYNPTSIFSYTKDIIEIPSDVYENAREEEVVGLPM